MYVVGTQKNHLNETVLLSTQNMPTKRPDAQQINMKNNCVERESNTGSDTGINTRSESSQVLSDLHSGLFLVFIRIEIAKKSLTSRNKDVPENLRGTCSLLEK